MVPMIVTRRSALKLAGIATMAGFYTSRALPSDPEKSVAHGYGRDPNLLTRPVTWNRTLTRSQLTTLEALCDIVLPAEPAHPSAAEIGVHQFLNEWVSAPYPAMQADRTVIVGGIAELELAASGDLGVSFGMAGRDQQIQIFEAFCRAADLRGKFATRVIQLICGGYYTTREGHAAIGYVGNIALTSFPGTSPEVVRHLRQVLQVLDENAPVR